jgi:hypothetical protein
MIISTKIENVDANIKPPKCIAILLAAKNSAPDSSILVKDVVLIASEKTNEAFTLTLAVTETQLERSNRN